MKDVLQMGGRKKPEAQQLQIDIDDDKSWQDVLKRPGLLVVDVYSDWCGPCSSMTGHLRRVKMEMGDDCLILATAKSDSISELEKFRGKAEPTFLFFSSGKPVCAVHGADGPKLLNNIREKLKYERKVIRGKLERSMSVVLLESLAKPEEVIEPDEDLDDVEGDMEEKADDVEVEVSKCCEAVLLISPNIIASDRTEAFLSQVVSAGFIISGHVQREVSGNDLHFLLYGFRLEDKEKKDEANKEENEEDDKPPEEKKSSRASEYQPEKEIESWKQELAKGPLYMLLLRANEGDIFESWDSLLGPTDLKKAKNEEPDCLVAQFGDQGLVIPAWMPHGEALQQRLKDRFFPPPPDADLPRLLLLPDPDEHQQVLESLCRGGVQVLAHTQVILTEDAFALLDTTTSSENLSEHIGCQLMAAVITGQNAVSVSSDLNSLHLTSSTDNAIDEISIFFPDLAPDLTCELSPLEEPQTQMQIEQKKEHAGK